MQTKHKYSRKVRLLGYGILAFQIITLVIWVIASYGNGAVLFNIASNSFNKSGSQGAGFVNSTSGETLNLPVNGAGFFSTTVSASLTIENSQNQTVFQQQSSVTVPPGQTQELSLTVPRSYIAGGANSNEYVRVSFEVSSIFGLVGTGARVVVNSCAFSGGCKA